MSDGCANIKTVLLRMKGEREREVYIQHIMCVLCVTVCALYLFTIIKREIVSK